jgi:hypothetical protein
MRRLRTLIALILMLSMLVVTQASSVAVTDWQTKASVDSRGLNKSWYTDAGANVSVRNPYAIRASFRTNTNVSRKVTYEWWIDCENYSRPRFVEGRTTTTATDGSWKNITIQSGSTTLGRVCDVDVYAEIADGARLRMRIQAKHP